MPNSFFQLSSAPRTDSPNEPSPVSRLSKQRAHASSVTSDRVSGVRYRASCSKAERIAISLGPRRDSDHRDIAPAVREVTVRGIAIYSIVFLAAIALGTWTAAVLEVWP